MVFIVSSVLLLCTSRGRKCMISLSCLGKSDDSPRIMFQMSVLRIHWHLCMVNLQMCRNSGSLGSFGGIRGHYSSRSKLIIMPGDCLAGPSAVSALAQQELVWTIYLFWDKFHSYVEKKNPWSQFD